MHTVFGILYVVMSLKVCCSSSINASEMLYDLIISSQNKNIRPCIECGSPLQLNVTFHIASLNDLDEVKGEIETVGFLTVQWIDERISWDPVNFSNLLSMVMPPEQVWHPKLVVGNPSRKISTLNGELADVRVQHTGIMSWSPGEVFRTKCYPNIYYYPFDKQTCFISIIPWGFSPLEIVITSTEQSVLGAAYVKNGEWTLVETSSLDAVNSIMSYVRFYLTFKRRSQFIVANVILPIVLLNFLNSLSFFIPTASGERVSYAVTVLLSFAVFITLLGDTIPKTSDPVPLLLYYLMTVFSGSTLMMVCNIFTIHIYYRDPQIPVTRLYRYLVLSIRKKSVGKNPVEVQPGSTHKNNVNDYVTKIGRNPETMAAKKQDTDVTWEEVSKCLDSVFFYVSIFHFIACSLVQLLIVPRLSE